MKRESFIFYRSFFDGIKSQPPKIVNEFIVSLVDYALNGTEPRLSGVAQMAFTFVKPLIDSNNRKYKSGRKGGRPKKTDGYDEQETDGYDEQETNGYDEQKTNGYGEKKPNDHDHEKGKEEVHEKEKEKGEDPHFFSRAEALQPGKKDLGMRLEGRIQTWNRLNILPRCRKTALNIVCTKMDLIAVTFQHYSDAEIDAAMSNYSRVLGDPRYSGYPIYQSLEGFLANGVEKFCEDAKPFERFLSDRNAAGGGDNLDRLMAEEG
jgi:hypothetical protein